jgi:F-type H+-transporting ATPase subunit gamma
LEQAREIKKRIDNISGTRKITKTMGMIASSRIVKARQRIFEARPFIEKVEEFIKNIAFSTEVSYDRLMKPHESENVVLVIGITSDRGLCGGYNASIIKVIEKQVKKINDQEKEAVLYITGTKGRNYFRYRGAKMAKVYEHLSDHPKFFDAREMSREFISKFVVSEVDKVIVCYTKFITTVEHKPTVQQILPIPVIENVGQEEKKMYEAKKTHVDGRAYNTVPGFIFEPSSQKLLQELIPEYIFTMVYGILLESVASEIGARMIAMKSASDSAEEMIRDLTIRYHKARQQQITAEIVEIISGAEAFRERKGEHLSYD